MVHFPASNLDPLRFTVQSGNECRVRNGKGTRPTGSQSVEGEDESSSPDTRPEDSEGGVEAEATNAVLPDLANGGEHPVINGECAPNPGTRVEVGESANPEQLSETLHQRKRTIYNLVAITVSIEVEQQQKMWYVHMHTIFLLQCHSGVLGGGHYTSFCRNPNGMWYYFNDSSCKVRSL